MNSLDSPPVGIFPFHKPPGITSFGVVKTIRYLTKQKKVGHTGTLDPFAQGLLILLLGKEFTKQADTFIGYDKTYLVTCKLGSATDTFDLEGMVTHTSAKIPLDREILAAIETFQGTCEQTPPMFSAKKRDGQKLYTLARQGIEVTRPQQTIHLETSILAYTYPYLYLEVTCSKGTYIRTLVHDLGAALGCYAHAYALIRTRIGPYVLQGALPAAKQKKFVANRNKK